MVPKEMDSSLADYNEFASETVGLGTKKGIARAGKFLVPSIPKNHDCPK